MLNSPSIKMSKRQWLDYLYYKEGKQNTNFWLCGTWGDKNFTKWRTYLDCVATLDEVNHNEKWEDRKFFEDINQRQILPHEIVFDLEESERINEVINEIKTYGWEYKVFHTGSRGYHIHVFFDEDFTVDEKEAIINKLGTDLQKCYKKTMIALENCPHWKTGKLKQEVEI